MLPVFEPLLLDKARLGSILREAREAVALTVRDVSARAGLSNSHISKIELGQIQVSADTFVRVCFALSLPPGLVLESCSLLSRGIYEAAAYNDPAVLQMASKSGKLDYTIRKKISDFIAGTALALSYLLKSSAPQNLVDRIEFPVQPQRECFRRFAQETIEHLSPIERNEVLVNTVANCYQTLTDLKLCKAEFVDAYLALCAAKPRGFQQPWIPLPKPPFYADAIPACDPLKTDVHIAISSFKRERRMKAAAKSGLTDSSCSVYSAAMQAQWPELKKRLRQATAQIGAKSTLAKILKVDPTQISQWLSDSKSAREPGAEYALQMQAWLNDPNRATK